MRMLRCQSGMSVIEFAFLLPVLVTLLVGTIEVSRYALMHLKTDKTAHAMADFLSRGSVVRFSDMDAFAGNAQQILNPYTFSGTIIFTAITFRDIGVPPCEGMSVSCVSWQYRPLGNEASRIGTAGSNANLPGTYVVLRDQVAIAAEIYFRYTPLLRVTGSIVPQLSPHNIYKVAVYKPRQTGSLMDQPF